MQCSPKCKVCEARCPKDKQNPSKFGLFLPEESFFFRSSINCWKQVIVSKIGESGPQVFFQKNTENTNYKLTYWFIYFFALGCSKGHTCQWLSDVYYYKPGWLRSWWLQPWWKCWNTQSCHGCVLGWLGFSKSLAHALICFVCTDYISIIDRICFPTHSPKLSQAVLQNVIFQCMVCSVLHIFVWGNPLFSKGERDIGSWLLTIRSGLKKSQGWPA